MIRRGMPSRCDGERRDDVGRRHDRAEHERDAEWQSNEPVPCERDHCRRDEHATNGEQQDRPEVCAERLPRHRERGEIDERRQHREHDDVGIELDRRQAGRKRKRDAGDYQQDRQWQIDPFGDPRDGGNHSKQCGNGV